MDLVATLFFKTDESSKDKATKSTKEIKDGVQDINNALKDMKSLATKAFGALGLGLSLKALNSIAEEFNGINDTIRGATRELGEQKDIQKAILEAATETRMTYGSMGETVAQFAKTSLEAFDGNYENIVKFAELSAKALKATGNSEGQVTAAQNMLNRVLATGTLAAGDFQRMMRQYPELINTMVEGLGMTKDELTALATEGKLTAKMMIDAFSNAEASIQAGFDELDYSISDAMVEIRNQWGLFIDQFWVNSHITNDVGKMMVRAFNDVFSIIKVFSPYLERTIAFIVRGADKILTGLEKVGKYLTDVANKFGGVDNIARVLAMTFGVILAVAGWNKLIGVLKVVLGIVTGINLKMVLIAAGIALVMAVVDDLIQFIKGNDSLIGEVFDKMGIGADNAREMILGVFNTVQNQVIPVLKTLGSIAKSIFDGIASVVQGFASLIVGSVMEIYEGIGKLITKVKELSGLVPGVVKTAISFLGKSSQLGDSASALASNGTVSAGTVNNTTNSGRTHNVNVSATFNNSYTGIQGREGQAITNAMEKSGKDLTTTMAHGLAFGG